jgi:dsRNA-specific ribonuclease
MSFTPNSATTTNHLTLKRARSVHDARPIIPKLRGDVILQVFTHRSLRGYDERLPELGSTVLDAIVTHILFSKVPPLRVSEIQVVYGYLEPCFCHTLSE